MAQGTILLIILSKAFSGQPAQMLSKLNRSGIRRSVRPLVPTPQFRTQRWQEEALDRLMDSWRVGSFHKLKQIVRCNQSAHASQAGRTTAGLGQVAVVTIF